MDAGRGLLLVIAAIAPFSITLHERGDTLAIRPLRWGERFGLYARLEVHEADIAGPLNRPGGHEPRERLTSALRRGGCSGQCPSDA